jgi:hypothetical protein
MKIINQRVAINHADITEIHNPRNQRLLPLNNFQMQLDQQLMDLI